MQKVWGYIVAGLIAIIGLLAAMIASARGDVRRAQAAVAGAAEKNAVARVNREKKSLAKLKTDVDANDAAIRAIEDRVAREKKMLEAKFTRAGLSRNEIEERLGKISL
jgi:hypothetical protein